MQRLKIFSIFLLLSAFLLPSCNEPEGDPIEPIFIDDIFNSIEFLSHWAIDHIKEDGDYSKADVVLITHIAPNRLVNSQVPDDIYHAKALAFFKYPSKVKRVELSGKELHSKINTIYDMYFINPDSWDMSTFTYGAEVDWNIIFTSGDTVSQSGKFAHSLHLATIKEGDSIIYIKNSNPLKWIPADDGSELWFDFSYYPKDGVATEIKGIKIEDDGNHVFLPNELKNFGIDTRGKLFIRLTRIKKDSKEFELDGSSKLLVSYAINETVISVNIME